MNRGGGVLAAALLLLASCGRADRPPRPSAAALDALTAPCILLTDPHAADALVVNAGAQVSAPRCELHVASDARPSATLNAESRLDVGQLCVASDISRHGGVVANPLRGCSAAIDPWLRRPPAPPPPADAPCDDRPHAVAGAATLHPGVWCGGLAFNGAPSVVFAPGLYVIRGGDWSFNGGTYRGAGVSLFFADGSKPMFNSGVDLQLSAPMQGTHRGVLIDEVAGLPPSTLAFNDARAFRLDGVVHLPSRRTVWNAGSRLEGRVLAVFDAATLNATRWELRPLPMEGVS